MTDSSPSCGSRRFTWPCALLLGLTALSVCAPAQGLIGGSQSGITELTLTSAEVRPLEFRLAASVDPLNNLHLTLDGATPGSSYFIFYSLDPLNVSAFGQGPWGGLWISLPQLLSQYELGVAGVPIFGGTINGCGQMNTIVPALPSIPGSFFSIAVTPDANGNWQFSDVVTFTLM